MELYKSALKSKGGAKYVVSFLMFDDTGRPLYWLLFCTHNIRGLEVMKRAMWAVDKTGSFRFSDKDDPTQLRLLEDSYSQPWLAEELRVRLGGRTMTAFDVVEFVLVETPCYLFRGALKELESKGDIKVSRPIGRKDGSFPPEILGEISVKFPAKSMF